MPGDSNCCPVLRPTKAQFSRPFANYVSDYFRKNPEVPIIKVVPPKGFAPRKTPYPSDLKIDTPIEQKVSDAYCLIVSVAQHGGRVANYVMPQVLMHDNKPGYYDCVLLSKDVRTSRLFSALSCDLVRTNS